MNKPWHVFRLSPASIYYVDNFIFHHNQFKGFGSMDAMNLKHRNPARGPAPKDSSSSSTCSSSATAIARSLSMDESETSMSTRSSDEQSRGTTVSDKDENSFQAAATSSEERPWTVLSDAEIKSLLIVASFAAVISPLTTSTYYPSITAISRDLGVSVSKINLTISTYQVRQAKPSQPKYLPTYCTYLPTQPISMTRHKYTHKSTKSLVPR